MNDYYVLIKKLYSSEDISLILNKANNKKESDSKVGNRVSKENKIRKDVFFSQSESNEMDNIYFYKIQKIVKENFKLTLKYRESYKIGTYYHDEKGFYIPHTDTQGTMQHRKISIVICLSKMDKYEGGIFKFINLKKDFKFDIGDIIIFDSNILHGVEPVTSGKRQVLVSFMWDEEGEQIRQKNNPTINNSRYLPKQIKNYNNSYKWIESYVINKTNNIENFLINDLIIYKSDYNKLRIGRNSDGGYVVLDIPNINYDIFISGGISNDDSFEHDFINKYKNVFCEAFDFSVDKLPNPSEKIHFNKKFISTINDDKYTNLQFYMEKYNNIFLKLDIEGSEHKWFDYLNDTQLNNISQMVVEFHYYPNITKNFKNFSKINKFFHLVHLHANNCRTKLNNSGLFDYKGNIIPWVFECTYVNKKHIHNIKLNNNQVPDNRFDYKNLKYNDDINLNYFPYKFEYDKLITLIPPDSGPGNQIIGIKECLILSKLLNRICIMPPIREHYLKSNKIFYNFNDIFTLNLSNIIIDNEHSKILNHIDNNKRYCIHSDFINKKLYHEQIIDSSNNNEILLNCRAIKDNKNLSELKNITDNLIIIKHLFNNVYINESGINGDFHSNLNSNFENIYSEICSNWDYSNYIKLQGDDYIKKTFDNLSYTAIHIRLPDIMYKTIEEYTNNEYSNNKIVEIISNLKTEKDKPIFIASNNINYLKKIGIVANFIHIANKYNSFIEQYICGMSEKFYYLNIENTRFNSSNNRSTWTSFVIDYRTFLREQNNNFNLRN